MFLAILPYVYSDNMVTVAQVKPYLPIIKRAEFAENLSLYEQLLRISCSVISRTFETKEFKVKSFEYSFIQNEIREHAIICFIQLLWIPNIQDIYWIPYAESIAETQYVIVSSLNHMHFLLANGVNKART